MCSAWRRARAQRDVRCGCAKTGTARCARVNVCTCARAAAPLDAPDLAVCRIAAPTGACPSRAPRRAEIGCNSTTSAFDSPAVASHAAAPLPLAHLPNVPTTAFLLPPPQTTDLRLTRSPLFVTRYHATLRPSRPHRLPLRDTRKNRSCAHMSHQMRLFFASSIYRKRFPHVPPRRAQQASTDPASRKLTITIAPHIPSPPLPSRPTPKPPLLPNSGLSSPNRMPTLLFFKCLRRPHVLSARPLSLLFACLSSRMSTPSAALFRIQQHVLHNAP